MTYRALKSTPLLLILAAIAGSLAGTALAADRPNIILIMADDLGAEGLGCYGSTIYTTPQLDQMASEGIRFNNAYATPLCTPTRVMLMSGLYPNRTGFTALIGKDDEVRMPAELRTFGHDFRDAGYKTAIAGKWQLGQFNEHSDQPIQHGFDSYCMWTWFYDGKKSSRYYSPQIYQDGEIINGTEKDFGPDHYSQYLLDFIDQNKDEPFLIYYPMALVHSPYLNPPSLEELAATKFNGDLDKSTREFGHMITYIDDIVGKFMSKLKEHDLEKKTLILFTGDNGTGTAITSHLPGMKLKGGKGSMTEAGTRIPLLAWWPGTIKPAVRDELVCLVDIRPTIAAVAGIKLENPVDGLDLSHLLLGKQGRDREHVLMSFKKGFFVRDQRFRLDQDGTLFDISTKSDQERYSEMPVQDGAYSEERSRLKLALDEFMSIEQETEKKAKTKKKKSAALLEANDSQTR